MHLSQMLINLHLLTVLEFGRNYYLILFIIKKHVKLNHLINYKFYLLSGDVILEIDGMKMSGALDVINAIGLEVGKNLNLKIERDGALGQKEVINVMLKSDPAQK